jgi:hypothetical protein
LSQASVIITTQEAEIRRNMAGSQQGKIVYETHLEQTLHKKGLVEWLKV